MKKLFLLFALLMSATVLPAADTVKIQTRSRTNPPAEIIPAKGTFPLISFPGCDFRINYKTIELDPSKTVLLIFDSVRSRKMSAAFDEMKTRIGDLAQKIESLGGSSFRTSQTDPNDILKKISGKTVFIAGVDERSSDPERIFALDKLRTEKIRFLIVRDLIETSLPPNDFSNRARNREIVVGQIEKDLCPSVSSSDFLGGPAFHLTSDKRRHVVMIVSDDHYDAGRSFPLFAEYLMDRYPVRCTIVHGEGGSGFMEIDELDNADAMTVFVRRLQVPAPLLEKLKKNLANGVGLVGFRTSSHAFDPRKDPDPGFAIWPEFDKEVQGGNYHNHAKSELGTDIVNVSAQKKHPILQKVEPNRWHSIGSLYFTSPAADDAIILQYGSNTKNDPEPLTWIRSYGPKKARVAYTGLGHPDDFSHKPGLSVMTNLILWTAGVIN